MQQGDRSLLDAGDPDAHLLRKRFELQARIFFHGPRGIDRQNLELAGRPVRQLNGVKRNAPLILYFHGGGYVFGSPRTHDAMLAWLCRNADARAILPDYRKAPEHGHPAAVEDAVAVYVTLLEHGENPAQIVVGGDSAGGGLAFAMLGVLLARGHPIPAGVFAFSPLADLTFAGASVTENAESDVLLPTSQITQMTDMFLGNQDPRDPKASPLFADFTGAPPTWLTAGSTEFLRDDTLRLADRLTEQDVSVDVSIENDLPHVWPLFHNILPEARQTLADLAAWIRLQTGAAREN